jgi:Flp pilus assembly protein TadD
MSSLFLGFGPSWPDEVVALEPLRTQNHLNLAIYLTALGRYDEAEAALRKAIALQPQAAQNYTGLAIIQILRGNSAAAVELAKQKQIRSGGPTPWCWLTLPTATGPRPTRR